MSAGPRLRVPDLSGHCWTSTASATFLWALPDHNREPQIAVATVGPQPRVPDFSVGSAGPQPRTPEVSGPDKNPVQRQIERQNVSQIEYQNRC